MNRVIGLTRLILDESRRIRGGPWILISVVDRILDFVVVTFWPVALDSRLGTMCARPMLVVL